MKILFDHQTFSQHKHGGVSRYFAELVDGINNDDRNTACLPLLYSDNIHLEEKAIRTNAFLWNYQFSKRTQVMYRVNKLYTLSWLKRHDFDIMHPTYFDTYFVPYAKNKPLVVTFHDMIAEKFSQQFKELTYDKGIIERKRELANRADKIIAVSESTKRDVIDILGINPEKIDVIYHGSSMEAGSDTDNNSPVDQAESPYVLYVGSRNVYKNFYTMLSAIQPTLNKHKLRLICAGGGPFTADEQSFISSLKLTNLVEQRRINDPILRQLYQQASAFIFPSLYEGFGIPILEAFDCNCPCIVNDSSSLPEVAGDAALYADFNRPDSVMHTIEQLLFDTELRRTLIKKGRQRLRQFSWHDTVARTTAVYQSLL